MAGSSPDDSDTSPAWPDLAGRLTEDGHVLPVRVYFEDTDFSGVVYHASYIRWCERGRSDYLRMLGVHHTELIDAQSPHAKEPAAFVVRSMEIDFLQPARIDDILTVATRVAETTAATLVLDQKILRQNKVIFTARVKVVLVSQSGKPQRLSDMIRDRFQHDR